MIQKQPQARLRKVTKETKSRGQPGSVENKYPRVSKTELETAFSGLYTSDLSGSPVQREKAAAKGTP